MARKKLDTLTEQMYYVLLALTEERHGYGIMQDTAALTGGRVIIGAGTLYARCPVLRWTASSDSPPSGTTGNTTA